MSKTVGSVVDIDSARFRDSLEESGQIGRIGERGLDRLSLGESDRRMRDRFAEWCRADGFEVEVDPVGNMFARLEGSEPELAPVMIGSHLDSQVSAGRYDGTLGVLAGLEVLRSIRDHGLRPRRPIVVVDWTNEEGARFQPSMAGSGAFSGALSLDEVLAAPDPEGTTLGEALAEIGYRGEAPLGRPFDAYYEFHIEQGPRLDASELSVGLVTGGWPTRYLVLEVEGETAHSGPAAMSTRRDALLGASVLVTAVNDLAARHAPEARATVARLEVSPNLPGIVSDRARVTIDMRHPEVATVERMVADLEAGLDQVASRARVDIRVVRSWRWGPVSFDPELLDGIRAAARARSIEMLEMRSLAGHDAYHLAEVGQAAMIFCPCVAGISHNVAEDIEFDRVLPGVNVLLGAVMDRADRASEEEGR